MDLFNQQPLLLQLIPHLDRGLVLGINRIGPANPTDEDNAVLKHACK